MFERWSDTGRTWPQSAEEARWGLLAVVGCFLGAQALAVFWIGIASGLIYGSDPLPLAAERPIWTLLAFNLGLWLGYSLLPIVAKRLSNSGPMRDFSLRITWFEVAAAALIGIVTQLVFLPALYFFVLKILSGDPDSTAQALGDRLNNVGDIILFGVAVIVVAPLVEEWFYRGMVLPTLTRRFGVVAGVISSSAVFALVHGEVILLPGLFCFALILAGLTVKTGRIGAAVVAHMTFNATTVVQLILQ